MSALVLCSNSKGTTTLTIEHPDAIDTPVLVVEPAGKPQRTNVFRPGDTVMDGMTAAEFCFDLATVSSPCGWPEEERDLIGSFCFAST